MNEKQKRQFNGMLKLLRCFAFDLKPSEDMLEKFAAEDQTIQDACAEFGLALDNIRIAAKKEISGIKPFYEVIP